MLICIAFELAACCITAHYQESPWRPWQCCSIVLPSRCAESASFGRTLPTCAWTPLYITQAATPLCSLQPHTCIHPTSIAASCSSSGQHTRFSTLWTGLSVFCRLQGS